jgi:hypothetical protein
MTTVSFIDLPWNWVSGRISSLLGADNSLRSINSFIENGAQTYAPSGGALAGLAALGH